MRVLLSSCALVTALGWSALSSAATLDVAFDIPQVNTGKNARPYVAIWAENQGESKPLLVWHLQDKQDEWLSDLRRWWRKIGRYDSHIDSMTGATKGPGHYNERFEINDWEKFTLYVEAARENGGHSLVKTKINLLDDTHQYHIPADTEIGNITIKVTP
ncbi:DUF2271 domain-containing protein [Marinomonas algarum]|uniref:DUF2271 domain-containing protein n=1 Tax=Marinomonas algarum TaxID=2883105 RepID=A0A9X1IMK1_9GAMM|nr:DUF2271 domain-containing protein [Marinomonas algarum]MCB5161076.1 DUF2271 domain-containing protein [Marinomonas algarum]